MKLYGRELYGNRVTSSENLYSLYAKRYWNLTTRYISVLVKLIFLKNKKTVNLGIKSAELKVWLKS